MTLIAGTRLGPYELLGQIGAGGMGQVWKARDTRLGRTVAIKQLTGQHTARFVREAQAIAALNHPNICTLHDIGPDYLVMEYVEGSPVKGPMPPETAVPLALSVAEALVEAHARGILHCDLKPANVLVTARGTVKLLDFGLARLLGDSSPDATRTIEGTISGTAPYMSPEQAQGQVLDERSDVYGVGAVLYEMLSGRAPFAGTSLAETLSAVLRDEPRPLNVPPDLARFVRRCLSKSRSERFASMAEALAALRTINHREPALSQRSIAVLPFTNMSADKENEYFSDGLAEEIINALAKLPDLKVTARTSAFAFRGKDADVGEIARRLNVEHILEGSVRKAGNRVRVTAQLVKAADGFHVWSERYDREMTDIFAIQDEISAAIARQLQVSLSARAMSRRKVPKVEAYEAYLASRHEWYKLTPAALQRSLEFCERALAIDPHYAEAYVGLAAYYFGVAWFGGADPREMLPKARTTALRAVELDEESANAHALVGAVKCIADYDWAGGEAHLRRALALDRTPHVALTHALWCLRPQGRLDEALDELQALCERDPLAAFAHSEMANVLLLMRRYEDAALAARRALDLESDYLLALFTLVAARVGQMRYEEGIAAAERAALVSGRWLVPLAYLGYAYAAAGRLDDARAVRDEMHRFAERTHVNATALACIEAAVGDIDRAIEWLHRAIDQREPIISTLSTWPVFDPVRSHADYPVLLRKMNLPVSGSLSRVTSGR
jgi:eukaryotic-like serine/threonine-protein kinase